MHIPPEELSIPPDPGKYLQSIPKNYSDALQQLKISESQIDLTEYSTNEKPITNLQYIIHLRYRVLKYSKNGIEKLDKSIGFMRQYEEFYGHLPGYKVLSKEEERSRGYITFFGEKFALESDNDARGTEVKVQSCNHPNYDPVLDPFLSFEELLKIKREKKIKDIAARNNVSNFEEASQLAGIPPSNDEPVPIAEKKKEEESLEKFSSLQMTSSLTKEQSIIDPVIELLEKQKRVKEGLKHKNSSSPKNCSDENQSLMDEAICYLSQDNIQDEIEEKSSSKHSSASNGWRRQKVSNFEEASQLAGIPPSNNEIPTNRKRQSHHYRRIRLHTRRRSAKKKRRGKPPERMK